jgi:hypothetical protein
MKCFLCEYELDIKPISHLRYICKTCGEVWVEEELVEDFSDLKVPKHLLSGYFRECSERKIKPVKVTTGNYKNILDIAPQNTQERIDKLLEHIERKAGGVGQAINFTSHSDYPLAYVKNSFEFYPVLSHMRSVGYISLYSETCILQIPGVQRLEEIRQKIQPGAFLLDSGLVNKSLRWLAAPQYKTVYQPLEKGLSHYRESVKKPERLADVVTDIYEAMEALAKIVSGKSKDLSANSELFISKVGGSEHHKVMLKAYIAYANDFRHAADPKLGRPIPSPIEVENFIYLTGLFIRFAIEKLKD